jgi:NAD-dependent SIR2 family protein deacetylase
MSGRRNPIRRIMPWLRWKRRARCITQNVDGLHQAAGSRRVIELHGALGEVICLDCEQITARSALQTRLFNLNPGWGAAPATVNPDGDAEIARDERQFVVPTCLACGGVLKPRVVFFGERVPPPRVERAFAAVEEANALLVAGTSLQVWSGLRFVRRAAERGMPIALINLGPTRADDLATVRVDARVSDVLPALVAGLSGSRA